MKHSNDDTIDGKKAVLFEEEEGLSEVAIGYSWVVRIISLAIEFAVLIFLGYWIDLKYHIKPWGMVVGSFVALYVFITGLVLLTQRLGNWGDDTKK